MRMRSSDCLTIELIASMSISPLGITLLAHLDRSLHINFRVYRQSGQNSVIEDASLRDGSGHALTLLVSRAFPLFQFPSHRHRFPETHSYLRASRFGSARECRNVELPRTYREQGSSRASCPPRVTRRAEPTVQTGCQKLNPPLPALARVVRMSLQDTASMGFRKGRHTATMHNPLRTTHLCESQIW